MIPDQVFCLRDDDGKPTWRAVLDGELLAAEWPDEGAAKAGLAVERRRKDKPLKPRKVTSRTGRWEEATVAARAAYDAAKQHIEDLASELDSLRAVREEYEEWRDNLPDNQQDGATAEKLNTIVDIDIPDDIDSVLDDVENAITEAEGADLPLGYGRD